MLTLLLWYFLLASPVVAWVLYLAIMNLAARRVYLRGAAKVLAYGFILPWGYVVDAALNLSVCLLFWRVPQDWLLTGTLKRVLNTDDTWRATFAASLCTHFLDPFDSKGRHCG